MTLQIFLFFIIFLEGYIVLSTELLALRLIIPFVGNATDTTAIIIAAVLMPLAFGYYAGGAAKHPYRKKLVFNLCVAGIFLVLGLSYPVVKLFFEFWSIIPNVTGRLVSTSLYALTFLVVPIFLLGQTVPLVSHFLKSNDLSRMTGRILFFSTIGSFMGAIICTIVLMPLIGVHHTVSLTIAAIVLLIFLLCRRNRECYVALAMLALSIVCNSNYALTRFGIVANNQYNTIKVFESADESRRFMIINNTAASGVYTKPGEHNNAAFPYIDYVDKNFIAPPLPSGAIKDILIIGTGGFTVGQKDLKNNYTFVDIDPELEHVAQDYLLGEKLPPNKKFIAADARSFIADAQRIKSGNKFDLIFLDIYQDNFSAPAHTTTQDFLRQLRATLKPGGVMVANFIVSPNYTDVYAIRLDQTLRSVFPLLSRQIVGPFNPWGTDPHAMANVIYIMYEHAVPVPGIYTDDLNRSFLDKDKKP